MCPPTERDHESPEPHGSGPQRPDPHGTDPSTGPVGETASSPSTDPGHAADPYEALYRPASDAPARNPRPLGQYRQTVSAPEEQADHDRYGWLFRPETDDTPLPSPRESRYGAVDPRYSGRSDGAESPLWEPAPSEGDSASSPSPPGADPHEWTQSPASAMPASPQYPASPYRPPPVSYQGADGRVESARATGRPAAQPEASHAEVQHTEVRHAEVREPKKRRRRAPIVITLLVVAALMGIAAGILVPMLIDGGAAAGRAGDEASRSTGPKAKGEAYAGKVDKVLPGSAQADCVAKPAQDDGGNLVTYPPEQVFDGDEATAWRCDGAATGEEVSFTFPAGTTIAEVGFINGYAKTDPKTEADRYPEYRRVLEATWTFPDGASYRQQLNDQDERMQKMRIPVTKADGVVLTINDVTDPGESDPTRDAVLISEVGFATPQ